MKLYLYSPERLSFVEVTWALPVFGTGVLLVAIVLWVAGLAGLAGLQASDDGAWNRSAASLARENEVLRYQVSNISFRANRIDREVRRLDEDLQILNLRVMQDEPMLFALAQHRMDLSRVVSDPLIPLAQQFSP